ncbi:hypothetical protein [Evansella clarkii]|uniref:hypothetical protein n=1 Tax=Evansella clarkii TaxID=79879 RepID=UPI0009980616|nr:hypothetical protein [Evansella clarkii]
MNKNLVITLSILLLISTVFNYQYLRTYQEEKRHFEIFSDRFVQQLHKTITRTQGFIHNDPVGEEFVNALMNLKSDLDALDNLLAETSMYIKDVSGGSSYFFRVSHILSNGLIDPDINPFYEELELTPSEKEFLSEFLKMMEDTHDLLADPDNPSSFNPELNHYNFNNIINENIYNYLAYNRFNTMIENF